MPSPPTWRELALALVVALAVFAWPLRTGLFDPSRILCGVDTAVAQLPWSQAPGGSEAVANPELADQGMVFYPAYRFAERGWSLSGPPLWNPLVYAGAPAIGNPQLGLLDPQVGLQIALGRLLGPAGFDWSFALLVWLRLALAAAGTYALARRLGLGRPGAGLAAVGFSTAGFVTLWANHSLGHVTSFLPWTLFALEGLRGARPGRAFAAVALLLACAIYGGHPETAFYLGLAAGVWCFSMWGSHRRAALAGLAALASGTLLAAPSLAPFAEYLANSGALVARRALPPAGEPDWIALGLGLLACGIVWRWRELSRGRPRATGVISALGVGIALAACAAGVAIRSGSPAPRLLFWPDASGHAGAYAGAGQFLEQASAWVAAPILVLALAAALTREPRGGAMPRRNVCIALGLVALLVALAAPGITDLYRHLPLIGLAAGVRFALVSALCLSLLAGEALERAPRDARVAAVACCAVLAMLALRHAPLAPLDESLRASDVSEGVVEFTARPERVLGSDPSLAGWIHPGLSVARAELAVERVGSEPLSEERHVVPIELASAPWTPSPKAPAGATFFRAPSLWLRHLPEGHWRFALRLFDADGALQGERVAAVSTLERRFAATPRTAIFWCLACAFVLGLSPGVPWLGLIVFAGLQGLWFLDGIHPAVERARVFPLTATERILERELGDRRYFAEPGVLPANTGMVRGLRALDGYDGLDPASFDGYRAAVLAPGVQPLLGFSARGARLDSAAFRLLGVGALVLSAPIDAPGFELIAGPGGEGGEVAECWIYRAREPLPRAFVVPRTVPREAALADLDGFDPLQSAFLEDGASFEPGAPFTRASVHHVLWHGDSVECDVELDGDGLFVLTEQHFPGWKVEVGGSERPLLRADSIFRAVALGAGRHRVVFRYAPRSWHVGLALGALGLVSAAAGAWWLARRSLAR